MSRKKKQQQKETNETSTSPSDRPLERQEGEALPVVVVGDGWGALGAVGFLASAGVRIEWVVGTGARLIPPLPSLESGPGVRAWELLARRLGVEPGRAESGSYLREFRNKAFREPYWTKSPTPETRRESRDEVLWSPEARFAPAFESRFERGIDDLEEELRRRVLSLSAVHRIEGVPVTGFRFVEGEGERSKNVAAVVLGSGDEIACSQVIFADRWQALIGVEGLPKPLPFLRGREPLGVLQATLAHHAPIRPGLQEAFYATLHKDPGDEIERHVWGCFSSDGARSHWTVCLTPKEVEDNHEITKKLRRLKQALDRMFTGTDWLPQGASEFMATVRDEQVRFEEAMLFGAGQVPEEPITLPKHEGIAFLTDGYGPAVAMQLAASLVGEDLSPEKAAEEEAAAEEKAVAQESSQGSPQESEEDPAAQAPSSSDPA